MGFWKKMVISASSGLFGRALFVVAITLGAGYAGTKFIEMSEANPIVQAIAKLIPFIIPFLLISIFMNLHLILDWLSERREAKVRESESKNEGLRLQKEILELEIQRDNQRSTQDDKR